MRTPTPTEIVRRHQEWLEREREANMRRRMIVWTSQTP